MVVTFITLNFVSCITNNKKHTLNYGFHTVIQMEYHWKNLNSNGIVGHRTEKVVIKKRAMMMVIMRILF